MKLLRQVTARRRIDAFTLFVFVGLMTLIIGLLTNPGRP